MLSLHFHVLRYSPVVSLYSLKQVRGARCAMAILYTTVTNTIATGLSEGRATGGVAFNSRLEIGRRKELRTRVVLICRYNF